MKSMIIHLFCIVPLLTFGANNYIGHSRGDFRQLQAFNAPIDSSNVDMALIEAGVIYFTNEYRSKKYRSLLSYNENLSMAAHTNSEQMQIHHVFDHVNLRNRELSTLEKRALYVGYTRYTTLAENILYAYLDLNQIVSYKELCNFIVNSFISSKGHQENLLNKDVDEIGCGIYFDKQTKDGVWSFYFTQDFGSRSIFH